MTQTTTQTDQVPDLEAQLAEARADVARITERIIGGATDVTAEHLLDAEATEQRLTDAVARQVELAAEGARRKAQAQADAEAEALRNDLAEQITANGGFAAEAAQAVAEAQAALDALWRLAEDHSATVNALRDRVAAVGRRTDLAPLGIRSIEGSFAKLIRVDGVGAVGTVEPWTLVAQAVHAVLDEHTTGSALAQSTWVSGFTREVRPLAGRAAQALAEAR